MATAKQETYDNVFDFQKAYPDKADRESVLKNMSDDQIDMLVKTCGTVQGKIYYSSFKKNNAELEGSAVE